MADQDGINLPLALSSSTTSWWDFHHNATCPTPSTSSWNNTGASSMILWENQNNSNSPPCDQEDVSITASNHSTLTVDDESFHQFVEPSSSFHSIITEPSDYWSQLFLGVEGSQKIQGEMRNEVAENLLNALSLKRFTSGMFEPSACSDYLQKFGIHHHNKWVDNNIGEDQCPNSNTNSSFHHYPVNIRSIAPPDRTPMAHHLVPHPCNNIIPPGNQHLHSDHNISDQATHNIAYQPHLRDMGPSAGKSGFDCYSYMFNRAGPDTYDRKESGQAGPSLGALLPIESNMRNQHGLTPSVINLFNQPHSRLASKPALPKSLSLLETRKREGTVRNECNVRGQVASKNEGKKKRSDDTSQSIIGMKKFRHESSSSNPSTATSPAKVRGTQTPKVKIAAEKISALQQIVSPYGKTDTASVLQEAIGFIKCHQEQVQLLINPYLKSSVNKLQEAWRIKDRKLEKGERINKILDLKSKGLCLVSTSNIPQFYEDSAGPDYWPAYRGCMYRS